MARTKGSKNSKPREKKVISDTIDVNGIEYTLDKIEIRDDGQIKKSNRHLRDIMRDIEEEVFDMNPLIQRADYQWTIKQSTKLIISILKGRPIGIITTAVVGSNEILVDGLQRLTTIKDFMEDKFKLSKDGCILMCNWIDGEGKNVSKEIDLGGKYYSQMPTALKKAFADTLIDHHQYWYFDDEEIEDIMYCMNNGSPFKPWQKIRTKLGETRITAIQDILNGTAWEKIRGCNSKNDTTLGLVIRSMMLLDGCGFDGLSVSAADKFVERLTKDGIATFKSKVAEVAKLFEDFDSVATNLPEEDWTFFDVTNTPQVIYNIEQFNRSSKSLDVYTEFIHKFINDELDDEENNIREYANVKKKSKGSGTAMKANAVTEARQWVIDNAMSEYIHDDEDVDILDIDDSDDINEIDNTDEANTTNTTIDEIFDGLDVEVESTDEETDISDDDNYTYNACTDDDSDDDNLLLLDYDKASSY